MRVSICECRSPIQNVEQTNELRCGGSEGVRLHIATVATVSCKRELAEGESSYYPPFPSLESDKQYEKELNDFLSITTAATATGLPCLPR